MDLDVLAKRHGLKIGARYRRFVETHEAKKYAGRSISGLPNWSASSKLALRFVKPGFDLFEDHGLSPSDHPNLVPLAAAGGEPDFFAVDASSPKAPVHYYDHEEGEFVQVAPTLDAFLGRLLEKGAKTPFERVRAALKVGKAALEKKSYAAALKALGELPKEWDAKVADDARELMATFLEVQGLALVNLKRRDAAKKAFARAIEAGSEGAILHSMAMHIEDGDPRAAIELGKDAVFFEDEGVFWVMRYLVEAYLMAGKLEEAEAEARALHKKLVVEDEKRLLSVRAWLEQVAAKNDRAGRAAKGFLEWFAPLRATAEGAGALRRWWDELPRFGAFWQPLFLEQLKLKKAPTDDQLARVEQIRHLKVVHDGPIDVTPLARLTGLVHVSLDGDVLSLEPLRGLKPELSVWVNNEVIRGLRMPARADRALLDAAKRCDEKAMISALDAGADPNAKTQEVKSVLHEVLGNFSVSEARKVALATMLIERGADLYVDDGQGETPLANRTPKAVRALEAAYAKTGRKPAESPFRVWASPEREGSDIASLKCVTKGADLHALPAGKLVVKIDSKRATRLVDCHEAFNYELVGIALVSARVRECLEREGLATGVEFLPVTVQNDAGKPIASDHVVLWPRQIECIDEERSEPRYRASFVTDESPPDDTNFSDVRRLVIDPAKVPKELTVFRAAHYTAPLLVRAEAAARIAAQGFEGFAFKPPRR